jgi:hypothetical protein
MIVPFPPDYPAINPKRPNDIESGANYIVRRYNVARAIMPIEFAYSDKRFNRLASRYPMRFP